MSSGSEESYPGEGKVLSTRVFESGPPVPAVQQEVLNTTKTEEWTTKKKTDKLVTKQIETRVKREILVTEDGDIIEDSGPQVTTDTTEETRTEENENTEHKTTGCLDDPGPGWTLVPGSKVISETKQSKNSTHETREEKTDTEVTEEVGGLTREEINRILKQKEQAAIRSREYALTESPGPILQSSQAHKVIDTNEINEVTEFKDGEVNTQTKKKSNREEFFDDDLPEHEALPPNWLSIAEARYSPAPTSPRRRGEDVVRITSPSSCLQSGTFPSDQWDTVSDRLRQRTREQTLRKLSEPESPTSVGRSTYVEQDDTIKRDTFDWIENHFGSQDLEESGLTGNKVTISPTSYHGSAPRVSSPSRLVHTIPVPSEDGSLRRVHYSKRQQMPSGRPVKSPAPPPPPLADMSWSRSKSNGHRSPTSSSSSLPKKQYYLGEDPGVGTRFTGTLTRPQTGGYQDGKVGTHSLARPSNSKSSPTSVKFATLGHDAHLHERENLKEKANRSTPKKTPAPYPPEVDLGPLPNVSDIIHSLRSKTFLEKENSAVSIRDDDSVFGPVPTQLYRPVRPPRHHRPAKQHVIKISIKSDDSDCSSPVNSPRYNGTPTLPGRAFDYHAQQTPTFRASEEVDRGANDSIVKNAINNLLKSRLNSSSDRSPGSSAYNSLSRQPKGSNLTSKTYLTISTPNVNKIETGPRPQKPSRYSAFNGSRSQSIGNLNHHSTHNGYSTGSPYHDATSNSGTPASNSHETKRHQFMQRLLDNRSPKEELPTYRKYVPTPSRWSGTKVSPRTSSPSSNSPPLSPTYTNRIKLPSSIPPSRTSSSPPPSPRSPPPPLTRPFSPYYQNNNNNRSYDYHNSNDYDPPPKPNYHRSKSSPRIYHTRSSSPQPYSRRPPSPVLPKGSSIGDDDSSNASGRSRSTNPGSRGSDISHPGERVEAVTRQKVTTTTTKKREIELPDSDYYYERSLPRDKAKSVPRIHNRSDVR